MTILTGKRARPRTQDGFRTEWRKVALAAGTRDLTFHDLRGTGITRLAEAGYIDQLVKRGLIPRPIAIGEMKRWRREDLDVWILETASLDQSIEDDPYRRHLPKPEEER